MTNANRIAIAFLLAAVAAAPSAHARAGWTDYSRLAELVATSKHYYTFRLDLEGNPSGCRDKSWFYQDYSAPGADKIFDALLESLNSEVRLRVYVTGICNIDGYAEISSLGIIP